MGFSLSLGIFVEVELLGHMENSRTPLKKLPDFHRGAEASSIPVPVDFAVGGGQGSRPRATHKTG